MLRWFVDVKIAITNLRATRMRTALTILGIVIGVASITTIMALGEGAKNMVRGQVSELGDNLLTIRSGKTTRDNVGNVLAYNFMSALGASTITEHDFTTIGKTEGITAAAPFMFITGSIKNDGRAANSNTIVATTPTAKDVLDFRVRSGEFINTSTTRQTVVLGQDLALQLLGSDVAIGHKVTLHGEEFTVVGILNHYSSSAVISNAFDFNNVAFISLDAGKGLNQGIAQIQQINARTIDSSSVKDVSAAVHQKLLANHENEEDFTVLQPEEALQLTDSLFGLLTGFTTAVASISILVGGVGIMNIMLVSVTERTREIGIRKAVGATNTQVLKQFLIEALVMSLAGGIVGVILGYALAFFAGTFLGFLPGISWEIATLAVGISIGVGLIFGAAPAIKAARKDPIEALRYFQ